jgi:uncharacterized protein
VGEESPTLRVQIGAALKDAMKAKEGVAVSTLRLIMAALKDRDIAVRAKGNLDGVKDDEILGLLQSMIKQRRDSIVHYEKGNRPELAAREADEIAVIERFLPAQLSEDDMKSAVKAVIEKENASSLKDMGRIMAVLKAGYAGSMDFSKASAMVKELLA